MLKKMINLQALSEHDIVVQTQPRTAVELSVVTNLHAGPDSEKCYPYKSERSCNAVNGCAWNTTVGKCSDDGTGDWD